MKYLKNYLKGIVVALATLVPGVSGGTMAIILGIYDDLIHAIGSFFEDWKKHSLFLLQVGLGGLTGLLLFSRLLESAVKNYPVIMGFLFIGVIFGGVPVLYKKSTEGNRSNFDLIFLLIGFVAVILLSPEPQSTAAMATASGFSSIIFLFVAGIVMAIALILPGISGSFMLLVLGLYDVTLSAINNRNIPFLVPLGLGILLGTLATTKAIEKLLHKYPSRAYMLILGFVLGSLIPVYKEIPKGFNIISAIIPFVLGFLVIFWIGKKDIGE